MGDGKFRTGAGALWLAALAAATLCGGAAGAAAPGTAGADPFAVPKGLLIGAGVSALQTEGGWREGGKAESAADRVLHTGKLPAAAGFSNDSHDVAADSYHRYKEDIQAAAELGLKLYRFSISWSRLLPDAETRNEAGVKFYHDYIDEVLAHNMTPLATLYHFDHPWVLEEQFKGWQSEKMVDAFKIFARLAFTEYGKKVQLWTTINEPNLYCAYFPRLFVLTDLYAPADMDHHECMRNTVLAHAEAYHIFKEIGHEGQVGFSAALMPGRPATTSPEDVHAANAFNQINGGIVLAPVVFGDWPQMVKEAVGSGLKPFSEAQRERLKGTTDFIGFNVYYDMTASYTTAPAESNPFRDVPIIGLTIRDVPFVNIMPGNLMDPGSLRSAIMWTWQEYKLPLIVSENGYGDVDNLGKRDRKRGVYHSSFLRTLVTTMNEYSIPVIGYCTWSLIDCFEWSQGYSKPYGLIHVDYEQGTLDRSTKDSSLFWKELARTGSIPLWEAEASSATAAASTGLLLTLALATNFL